jgi:hypothetical protein
MLSEVFTYTHNDHLLVLEEGSHSLQQLTVPSTGQKGQVLVKLEQMCSGLNGDYGKKMKQELTNTSLRLVL